MTQDLHPQWLNVARRCQSVSCQQGGYALVTIKVLVGCEGEPVWWFEPEMSRIEPRNGSTEWFARMLGVSASSGEKV